MSAWELAECVKINFENLKRAAPYIKASPFTKIVEMQINDLCEKLRIEEEK